MAKQAKNLRDRLNIDDEAADQAQVDNATKRIRELAQPNHGAFLDARERDAEIQSGHKIDRAAHGGHRHGTRKAADHELSSLPDVPNGHPGAKLINRPMTTGASG